MICAPWFANHENTPRDFNAYATGRFLLFGKPIRKAAQPFLKNISLNPSGKSVLEARPIQRAAGA
jgi:hypothetical protein